MDKVSPGQLLAAVRAGKPLVHHITNYVTVNDCANMTLHTGGLPVMAHAREEVQEMVACANALVLNIGTLDPLQVEAMFLAGKRANELGIPVVLDPVGAGATPLRTDSAKRLMEEVKIAILKGNAAEIGILAGAGGEIKGVEAVGAAGDTQAAAVQLARQRGVTVAVTGAVDLVTDGQRLARIRNGHPLMGAITGTGCMAASVLGCFVGVRRDDPWEAAVAGLVAFGLAGEKAAASGVAGPAAFKTAFLDSMALLTPEEVANGTRLELVTV
ncbi:MAG TPA: hydroxyethylthiazole kinase [Firmicutes bacterium]|nr:hydroxyethylthiazole kinase [Bacillota bacterium]